MNKLILILAAALLLGGCTLGKNLMGQSARDESEPSVTPTTTPLASIMPDADLDQMPSTSTSSDQKSIETDLSSTVILDEDFSDLE